MPAAGYVVRQLNVKLKTAAGSLTEYNTAVTGVKETPSRTTTQVVVASGETMVDSSPTQWMVEVTALADYGAGSLLRLLLDNDGAKGATIEWYPNPVAAPTLKRVATVQLLAPDVDNPVGSPATFTVSLPVQGAITTTP
jgi:hypothetical protein